MNNLYWAEVKDGAKVPTKREEDAGYDIYACFEEDAMVIPVNAIKMIPTGIASAFPSGYVMLLEERGSTGTKGLSRRAGVIDSGFRDEWQVVINNTSNSHIIISKLSLEELIEKYKHNEDDRAWFLSINGDNIIMFKNGESSVTIYPYEKAIAQALFLPLAQADSKTVPYDELKAMTSERGMGMLGSSEK
ncbi:MAG: dUTP pyrophosphatase [Clostridia bacterium]|nr:dUTP pyrophosphatase [Clostridia bacterium]NCD04020.1 dUTP pyrophosphatase [Clostridia bacterium]